MKKLLFIPLLLTCISANAVPDIWRSGFGMGWVEYSIQDAESRTLWVACESGAGDHLDHSAKLEINGKYFSNSDSEYPLTFLLDNRKEVAPPNSTMWRNGANAWYEFVHGMSKAEKIDVYINNKKVTTFTPNKASIEEVASGLTGCKAKW